MENHFHMIARCDALKKAVQSLKSYSALQILDELNIDKKFHVLNELKEKKLIHKTESQYQLWQEGYHPQEMSNNKILRQKIEYIHNNPVRKGLVARPEDWKYSSARCYLSGQQSDLIITPYY